MPMEPRKWVPDVRGIADQLVEDFSTGGDDGQGFMDMVGTLQSMQQAAEFHGDEFTEDDWIALVQELVRRIVLGDEAPPPLDSDE